MGDGDILKQLLEEERRAEAEKAAAGGPNDYHPETYGFLDRAFARHGEVSGRALDRAKAGYAGARRYQRHMVFRPRPEAGEGRAAGALFAVGRDFGVHGGPLVDLMWQGADGQIYQSRNLELPEGASPSLAGQEDTLRRLAHDNEGPASLGGGALSAYAGATERRARRAAKTSWEGAMREVRQDPEVAHDEAERMGKAYTAFVKIQTGFERRRYARSLSAFTRHLDPEAMKICHQTGLTATKRYNWLQGDGDPQRAQRRRQAARAYPLLFAEMSDNARGPATRAIDRGAPMSEVAGAMGMDETARAGLRRIQGLHWQRAGRYAARNPGEVVGKLARIPANWTPEGRKDWAAFHATMASAQEHARNLRRSADGLVAKTGGDWQRAAREMSAIDTSGALDMLNDVRERIVIPEIARRMNAAGIENWDQGHGGPVTRLSGALDQEKLASAVFGDKSLKKVDQAVRRWHTALPRANAAGLDAKAAELTWPALSQPHTTRAGWTVTPLTTGSALAEEGQAMQHCVGGYRSACVDSGVHILSIRDASGERVSTVSLQEVDPERARDPKLAKKYPLVEVGERTLAVLEHRGARNDRDGVSQGKARTAALDDYLRALQQDPPDYGRIDQGRAESARILEQESGLRGTVGYDPLDTQVAGRLYEVTRESMIGPGAKAGSPAEFLEAAGLSTQVDRGIAELAQRQAVKRDQRVRAEENARVEAAIQESVSVDPQARMRPAMSYAEYFAVPDAHRTPRREVSEVRPGEGSLRELAIARDETGLPLEGVGAAAGRVEEALFAQATAPGSFGAASVARQSDRPIVAFTREEAEAVQEVSLAVREQRQAAPENRTPLSEVMMSRAVRRMTADIESRGGNRGDDGRRGDDMAVA